MAVSMRGGGWFVAVVFHSALQLYAPGRTQRVVVTLSHTVHIEG